ncbi:MAG: hypothetical protein AB7I04_18480 [Pseudomonadales bacterium]
MAGAAVTRERRGARAGAVSEDEYSALLAGGLRGVDEDEGNEADQDPDPDELEDNEDDEDLGDESDDGDDVDDGTGDGEPGADDSDTGADDDESEDDAGDAASAAATADQAYLDSWAAKVIAKPGVLMQIPRARRSAVLNHALATKHAEGQQSLRTAAVEAIKVAREQAYEQGMADARAAAETDSTIEEMRQMAEEDPEAFGLLALTPEGRAKARRYLEHLEQQENGGKQTMDAESLRTAAQRVLSKVAGNEAAVQALQAKEAAEPDRYKGAEGLANLSEDVAELLANQRAAATQKANEPARKAAQARGAAARDRRALPRPPATAGRSGGQGGGEPASGDYFDYLSAGFNEARKGRK